MTLLSKATLKFSSPLFLLLFSASSFAATDLTSELVAKLMAQPAEVVTQSGLTGYTLKSVAFTGSYGASAIDLLNVVTKTEPMSATSQALCACTSGNYTLTTGSMGQVEVGESFTSNESLTTDTTVTVEGNYGAVSAKATTNISTNNAKSSSYSSDTLTQASAGAAGNKDLTCEKFNQPQCFIGTGSTNKITYVDATTGSTDINYKYDVFPVNNGSTEFNTATFNATLYKAGTTTPGPNMTVTIYDKNNKVLYELAKGPEPTNAYYAYAGNNAFFSGGTYKSAVKYNISWGGANTNNISVRFRKSKGSTFSEYLKGVNTGAIAIPSGYTGKDMIGIEFRNNTYIVSGDDTQVKSIPVSKVLTYDQAKHTITGIYNATDFTSLAMDVNFIQYSWQQLQRQPQYAKDISNCGSNLIEAKRRWKASCSSPGRKVIMFKKYVNENGPPTLPGGGKRIK